MEYLRTKLADLRFALWRVKRRWELLREQAVWRQRMKRAYAEYRMAHNLQPHSPVSLPLEFIQWRASMRLRETQREVWLRREALRVLA